MKPLELINWFENPWENNPWQENLWEGNPYSDTGNPEKLIGYKKLIYSKGDIVTNRQNNPDGQSHSNLTPSTELISQVNSYGLSTKTPDELIILMRNCAVASKLGGNEWIKLVRNFASKSETPQKINAIGLGNLQVWRDLKNSIKIELSKAILNRGSDPFDLTFADKAKEIIKAPNFSFSNGRLAILMGGTQAISIFCNNIESSASAGHKVSLTISIQDIFGVDEGDVLTSVLKPPTWITPIALTSFWLLQHKFNYPTFITELLTDEIFYLRD